MSSLNPFFGDDDNRDSDWEDFEEEAALLNESGGVSQPKEHIQALHPGPWAVFFQCWCEKRFHQGLHCMAEIQRQTCRSNQSVQQKMFDLQNSRDIPGSTFTSDQGAFPSPCGFQEARRCPKGAVLLFGPVILGDPFAAVDQKSVLLEKVQNATNRKGKSLEERCWLVLVGEVLARGGEVRYLNYDKWTFHQFTHVLDTQWTEMKTVNTYAMPFVPDKTHWTSDIYHALGSWFLVEDGLHRNMEEIEGGMQNVVFPSLRKTGESSTAKLLTQAIQKCLPEDIKSRITSRSLRDAGIAELASHGSLSIYDGCARSGHSTGTTQDHYISDQHYLYGLKAGMARAGYDVASGDSLTTRDLAVVMNNLNAEHKKLAALKDGHMVLPSNNVVKPGLAVGLCGSFPGHCQMGGLVRASNANGMVMKHQCGMCGYFTHGALCCPNNVDTGSYQCYYCLNGMIHPKIGG
ncbi:hypothetical protein IV203_016756 [Nitzschia inconspicua]|uniref:Uncharacterized protein n=1 Tax=Nitzschia inconspicua TaxID=303405 RepID=A0A9K3KR39_9STRA|nr:hypothetical protein IV203_016756 [Nitzschia inconspicua]